MTIFKATRNLKILLTFGTLCFQAISFAQTNYGNDTRIIGNYIDNNSLLNTLERGADSIAKTKSFLTAATAQEQLKKNAYKIVPIEKTKTLTKELSDLEIIGHLKKSFLTIGNAYLCGSCDETHISPASGYVIDPSGIFVTNHHVIDGYANGNTHGQERISLQVMTSDNRVYPVIEVLSSSKEADLAILKLDIGNDKLTALPLGDHAPVGTEVFVLSNPATMLHYFTKGIVARNFLYSTSKDGSVKYPEMQITADYAGGSSGAAVVDKKGNVISTVSTTRSIYYDPQKGTNLQMVVKGTKPVILLKDLITYKKP